MGVITSEGSLIDSGSSINFHGYVLFKIVKQNNYENC